MSNAWNNQQWNGSRVPPMHGGSQVGWDTDSDRSVSPPDTPLESLPFRKRYTRSHEPTEFGPSSSGGYQGSGGFQGPAGFSSNPSGFSSTNGSTGYSSSSASRGWNSSSSSTSGGWNSSSSSTSGGWNSSSASSGYLSSEDDKLPVDYSKPRDVVRAGVIRHSSNPRMCLAYYYLPK